MSITHALKGLTSPLTFNKGLDFVPSLFAFRQEACKDLKGMKYPVING